MSTLKRLVILVSAITSGCYIPAEIFPDQGGPTYAQIHSTSNAVSFESLA